MSHSPTIRPWRTALVILALLVALTGSAQQSYAPVSAHWLSYCLLTHAERTGDAKGAKVAAEQFATLYGKHPMFTNLARLFDQGRWSLLLPAARNGVEQFGAEFSYTHQGTPLADLARRLTIGLDSANCDYRYGMAQALDKAFPEQKIFGYITQGIEQANKDNDRYATTYVRGTNMANYAQAKLAEIKQKLEGDTIPPARERIALEKAKHRWEQEITRATALVLSTGNARPIGDSLYELEQKLVRTIDEMEVIGDL